MKQNLEIMHQTPNNILAFLYSGRLTSGQVKNRLILKTGNLLNFYENSKINVREKNCDFAAAYVFDCFHLFVILQFAC